MNDKVQDYTEAPEEQEDSCVDLGCPGCEGCPVDLDDATE